MDEPTERLIAACYSGDAPAASAALHDGADVNAREYQYTALHVASRNGHLACVDVLLATGGADIDAVGGSASLTPLSWAAHEGHVGVVQALLNAGADTEAPAIAEADRALHCACVYHRIEVVAELLGAGADKEAQDSLGRTPLCIACQRYDARIAAMLIKAGADSRRLAECDKLVRMFGRMVAELREEVAQLRSVQPGVQQLIIGAAGMLKRLHEEGAGGVARGGA